MTTAKVSWAQRLLPWTAVILLAGHMSGAMACLYEHGQMPIKPRDFTLGLVAVNLILAFLSKPSFRPAVLGLLIIPSLRLFDAAVLKRYTNYGLGDHSTAVMILANMLLVTIVTFVVLSTENWRTVAIRAAIAIILLDSGSVLYEGLGYAKYSQINGRAAGFLTQPNDSIIVMCLALGVLLTLNESFWKNALMIAIAAIGVGLTLSRSGMIVYVLIVMIWFAMNLRKHFTKIVLIVCASIPLIGAGIAMLTQMASSRNFGTDKNAQERIAGIFGGSTDKLASDERAKDLKDGWEAVTISPIVGYGTGCASSHWQPHNQWVGIWLDVGIMGPLMLFSTLSFITWRCVMAKGRGVLAVVPLWMFTVFSHNLVEMACYWFCAGVALMELTTSRFRLVLRSRAPITPQGLPA